MTGEIHQFDSTRFVFEFRDQYDAIVNIATASTLQAIFQRPDKSVFVVTASIYIGVQGLAEYQCTGGNTGELDATGRWRVEGYVVIGGLQYHSDIQEFAVQANLRSRSP